MDKNAIKSFAIESRRQMIESVKYQASLIGITADGISEPISKAEGMETYDYCAGTHTIFDDDVQKRKSLVHEVESKGFDTVIEEVSYTWFNRIIAIRYMEVNDYLPTRTRVLSSETEGKIEPDIITDALDLDLDYFTEDKELIFKYQQENNLDELFRLLFIRQCNKLNDILPGLFKKTDDYFELLLNISFTDETGVVRQLIDTISEDDFKDQIEIIGWLYQYYISEKKDQVINVGNKNIKKDDIPAATQIFTPDWVVKYMVDNSLGRFWIERNSNTNLKNYLEYYFDEPEQSDSTLKKLEEIRSEKIKIENLTFFDPCMGSGHILVYAFDVFFEIYKELGYLERDIPELIFKNNIYGLDIDDRAYQLAYFAVLMKSRKYDRKILEKGIVPNVFAIQESRNVTDEIINFIKKHDELIIDDIIYLKDVFASGKEFGSLIQIKNIDLDRIKHSLNNILYKSQSTLTNINISNVISNDLMDLINQADLLSRKYSAVVTNPPYMNKFDKTLKDFAKKYYKDYSKDLFSMFIYRNFKFCNENSYSAFMTPYTWMFIKNYLKLREYIISNKNISTLIQFHNSSFTEATVPICSFVLVNNNINYNGVYIKLSEFKGNMDVQNQKVLDALNNSVNYKFYSNTKDFTKIPMSPIAFWFKNNYIFDFDKIKSKFISGGRNKTHDNNKFVRKWWEVPKKSNWELYSNGGEFKKWYGNEFDVVDWSDESRNFYDSKGGLYNKKFWYKEGICWNLFTSYTNGFRIKNDYLHYSSGSPTIFDESFKCNYAILGFLNSAVCQYLIKLVNPTVNTTVSNVLDLPIKLPDEVHSLEELVKENILITKDNYDSFEISYDFSKNPLIQISKVNNLHNIEECFNKWVDITSNSFNKLKNNEEEINRLFIQLYGFNDEVEYNVPDKDITIQVANYSKDIKEFISYAVGCMFGRYNLDEEGLKFDESNFSLNDDANFVPDDDNIIPILDNEYFNDDIVGYFVNFVKACFGQENLEENLDFISKALDCNGNSNREIIRNYFLSDFFTDHVQYYKQCPIYWQFDSGKQNAFKCLIYMHRYDSSIIARVRTDYLHKTQKAIEQNVSHCENIIANSSNKSEISKATKDKAKYIKQLDEIKVYDEALRHMAAQNIVIDLDDGVKVNYAKFQKVEISIEGEKPKKINLLKNI